MTIANQSAFAYNACEMARGGKENEGMDARSMTDQNEFLRELERLSSKPQVKNVSTKDPFLDSLHMTYGDTPSVKRDVFGRRVASGKEVQDVIEGKEIPDNYS